MSHLPRLDEREVGERKFHISRRGPRRLVTLPTEITARIKRQHCVITSSSLRTLRPTPLAAHFPRIPSPVPGTLSTGHPPENPRECRRTSRRLRSTSDRGTLSSLRQSARAAVRNSIFPHRRPSIRK